MMRCKNCDSEIPRGKLECPFCGAEVLLVPEYLSADMERERQRREQEEEERFIREQEERREMRRLERRMKPGAKVVCALLIAAVAAGLSFGGSRLILSHAESSYGYLREMAFREYRDGHYDSALSYLERGLALHQHSEDLIALQKKILEEEPPSKLQAEAQNQPADRTGGE